MRILPLLASLYFSAIVRAEPVKLVNADVGNVSVCVMSEQSVSYRMKSNCSGEGQRAGHKALMSFNHLGLRDKDYPPEPPKGVYRILLVGSSTLVGPGISEENTPVRQMEKALRSRGLQVEVINGATEGYFTTQNAIRLREMLEAYHPQMVIYDFSPSAGVFTDAAQETITKYENGAPVSVRMQPLSMFPQTWHARIYANQRLFRILQTWEELSRRIGATWKARMAGGLFARDPARTAARFLSETERLLQYMKSASEKSNAFFLVSIDPEGDASTMYNVPPYIDFNLAAKLSRFIIPMSVPNSIVQQRLVQEGIRLVPVRKRLGDSFTLPGDYHYNDAGGQAAGRILADAFYDIVRGASGATRDPGGRKGPPRGKEP